MHATSRCLLLLLALSIPALQAQTVTVETILPVGSDIDDGLALGPDGALYGSRFGNFPSPVGRTVTRVALPEATTTVYADGFSRANGLAFGPDGTLYVANYGSGAIIAIAPDGTRSTYAQANTSVSGLAYDAKRGVLVVASYDGNWVKEVGADGVFVDVIVEGLNFPAGLAFDMEGRLYVANFEGGRVYRIDGTTLVLIADLPTDVGFLAFGGDRLFATGIDDNRVYEVTLDGAVGVLAGTGTRATVDGPGADAQFSRPNGIVSTPAGDTLYVSQVSDRALRRIVRTVETSAEEGASVGGVVLHPPAPNPVATDTSLRFSLTEPTTVELVLTDLLGRRLHVLDAGLRASGEHHVPLSMANLPAGVYFVTLRTDQGVATQRVIRR